MELGRDSRFSVLLGLTVMFVFTASSTTFYAGVVSETDVSQTIISGRWLGISGTVDRGNRSLSNFNIGSLTLNGNQTGQVLKAELEGVKGGGFYLGFTPRGSVEPDTVSNLSGPGALEAGGIFSQEVFPDFYPNYSQKFDNPSRTFDSWKTIKLNGRLYNASYANLSGSADMYLLNYTQNSTDYPLFISPIDGMERKNSFENCYVQGCNFQALLPRLNGSEFSYSVHLYSRGEAITGCSTSFEANETAVLLEGADVSSGCLDISAPGTYVDFYNSRLSGSGSCGITLTGKNISVTAPNLSGFDKGVCVEASGTIISKGDLENNQIGISANGNFTATNISLAQNNIGLTLQDAKADLENISLSGTRLYGQARSVSILSFSDTLPSPPNSAQLRALGSRVRIESTSQDARIQDLGLGYEEVNLTKVEPRYIYKYDQQGDSYTTNRFEATLDPNQRVAYYYDIISNFSVFTLYGQRIKGEDSGGEQGSGGSSGGGGGSGSGGASGGGGPVAGVQRPEPVTLNLSTEKTFYSVKRGDTVSIAYGVNNTGEVVVGNVTARLDSEWTSVPNTFDALKPGDFSQGTILLTVPEDASEGNNTFDLETVYRGSTLDSKELTFNVSDLLEESRLEIVESPPFLNLETSTSRSIGVLVENPTNNPINDLSVSFRGGSDCATAGDRTYSVSANTAKNLQIILETSDNPDICNDALVFRNGEEIMGFAPMRIELNDDSGGPVSLPVYLLLLLIWTVLLLWRIRNKGERRRGFV